MDMDMDMEEILHVIGVVMVFGGGILVGRVMERKDEKGPSIGVFIAVVGWILLGFSCYYHV